MIKSKLISRGRTTVPLAVRRALRLTDGDDIAYSIEGARVVLTKAEAGRICDPFAAFGEWSSEANRRAYAEL
jgi:antitoxin PrlF